MGRFSDIMKRQTGFQGDKKVSRSSQSRSSLRISGKVRESAETKPAQRQKEEKEIGKMYLSGSIKEREMKKGKSYKEIETRISVFHLAQIVREREEALNSPHKIYERALKKIIFFWEELEKNGCPEIEPLNEIIVSMIENYKNTGVLLANLTKNYPPEHYLPYHSLNAGLISLALGWSLNWKGERLKDLILASFLHDIGMSRVPKEIYLKADSLKYNERDRIKEHSRLTLELLEKEKKLNLNVTQIAYQHHERFNGGGYPEGLKGKDIHPGARILALADVYEALTHLRLYHKRRFPYDVIIELISKKGEDYDTAVLKALIQEITFYPLESFVELNTGEIAIVEGTLPQYPTRPKVKILINEGGEKLELPRECNLFKEKFLYIQRPIFNVKQD